MMPPDSIESARSGGATQDSCLETGRRVLRLEADALLAVANALDDRFSAALALLSGVRGRVVVTGMGKSGHVARKIAATLASTGTPAVFVHPAEAAHGDLGMIVAGDALLALSNSGGTAELGPVLDHAVRMGIPVVAVTGREPSPLADAASVTLLLPNVAEACPMGLAPTTSTTMALALGDALAVALLERRGFSAEDFRTLHPGGSLGRRLVRVEDVMHTGAAVPLVPRGTRMSDALLTITAKSFGCVGITGPDGGLDGIVTDGDLRRNMSADLLARTVDEVMTPRPRSIRPRALAAEAVATMNAVAITSLFVVEDARPVGIVHLHDCLRAGIS